MVCKRIPFLPILTATGSVGIFVDANWSGGRVATSKGLRIAQRFEVNSDRYEAGTTYDKRPNFDRSIAIAGLCPRTVA